MDNLRDIPVALTPSRASEDGPHRMNTVILTLEAVRQHGERMEASGSLTSLDFVEEYGIVGDRRIDRSCVKCVKHGLDGLELPVSGRALGKKLG